MLLESQDRGRCCLKLIGLWLCCDPVLPALHPGIVLVSRPSPQAFPSIPWGSGILRGRNERFSLGIQ